MITGHEKNNIKVYLSMTPLIQTGNHSFKFIPSEKRKYHNLLKKSSSQLKKGCIHITYKITLWHC